MDQIILFLKRHSLVAGIVLMFAFTWPIDLAHSGVIPLKVPFGIYLFLGYGFGIASLLMTGLTHGRGAVVALFRRFFIWRVGWRWYLVAFLLYPSLITSGVLLNAALTHRPLDFGEVMAHRIFGTSANLLVFILPFFLVDAISNGEEIGWRGYVLPRLQAKHSALASSLILGVIWGFWHLPKYLAPGNTSSFALFMLKIVADSVLYTWLFNNTKGSLLLTTIFHASGNTAGVFLPIANTVIGSNAGALIFQILLETLVVIAVVIVAGSERLSRSEATQVQGSPATHSAPVSPVVF